jgi:hypothetical protein
VGVHFGLAGQGPETDHQRFTRIPGGGAELGARRRDIALPVLLGERRTQYNHGQNEPIRRRPLLSWRLSAKTSSFGEAYFAMTYA